ncbi:NmrA family NAD(P)-binding protein [Pseudovibrio brasiliensis]|uniref:NmrA family NAD(P)-binding protein n=1 Tax=Pseudovibrio brasiliensis TaxID=1898042 RepID=A0ABX8AVC1_9HYPH|nr:NmrA family NAD(P)-binding protein [Pseudovibrio brasiliensis]QUS59014.1 NmrA family NAD(P)-binding protein [Pseudovibrio brasiliensis]
MKVGITTPRGNVGSKIVRRLISDSAHDLVLLDHRPEKSYETYGDTVKVTNCDITDLDQLIESTVDLDVLYMVVPPSNSSDTYLQDFIEQGKKFRDAVNANAIPRVVFQSSYGGHLPYGTGPIVGLFHVEQELNRTAASVVHLRACYFMENFLWFKNPIDEKGIIPLPVKAESKTIYNSTDDIADRAVSWLTSDKWSGKIIDEIHGENLSFLEVAKIISRKVGKDVSVFELTDEQSIEAYTQPHIGFSKHYAKLFNELHRGIDNDLLVAEFNGNELSGVNVGFEAFVETAF